MALATCAETINVVFLRDSSRFYPGFSDDGNVCLVFVYEFSQFINFIFTTEQVLATNTFGKNGGAFSIAALVVFWYSSKRTGCSVFSMSGGHEFRMRAIPANYCIDSTLFMFSCTTTTSSSGNT